MHARHTATLVCAGRRRVLLDCGEDWLGNVTKLRPHAILLTHAHPDHAGGLSQGAPCPVYATSETWAVIDSYPIADRHLVAHREPFEIAGTLYEAFAVDHSIRCPAVGYRITSGRHTLFYVPDVLYIPECAEALKGIGLYIGDGATLRTSLVRKTGNTLVGHTPIRTQLTWCQKEKVPAAVFTHCGKQIVAADQKTIENDVRAMAGERGVNAVIAHDGMEIVLR